MSAGKAGKDAERSPAPTFAGMVPLLPAFYFGSVEHYRLLARHPQAVIDIGEHYVRQSHRTRTRIAGPNGPQELVAQAVHGQGRKVPMREALLSYAEPWPQQHLHAIRSAYGNAPWFIHYYEDIAEVLLARHQRLADLDLATLRLALRWLGLPVRIEVREAYVEAPAPGMADLRTALHPKKPLPPGLGAGPPYPQVFAHRHGFLPRLSAIDLVMNLGPMAGTWLREE